MMRRHLLSISAVGFVVAAPLGGQSRCEQGAAIDGILFGTSTALIVVDWSQTAYAARHSRNDSNPLLGWQPSAGRVNTLLVTAVALNVVIAALPLCGTWRDARRLWWAAVIGLEFGTVWHNARVQGGLRFGW